MPQKPVPQKSRQRDNTRTDSVISDDFDCEVHIRFSDTIRNAALGRVNTAAEQTWLDNGGGSR